MPSPLAQSWLDAAARPEVASALEAVYAKATAEIAARGPACWASGRCCNFREVGHLLYVTGLEAAYTVARLPQAAATAPEPTRPDPTLRVLSLEQAKARGGCPFQAANLCSVHTIKPLGCRVYFCDASAQEWQMDLSERLLREVRDLHERFEIEYRYGEWLSMLDQVRGDESPR